MATRLLLAVSKREVDVLSDNLIYQHRARRVARRFPPRLLLLLLVLRDSRHYRVEYSMTGKAATKRMSERIGEGKSEMTLALELRKGKANKPNSGRYFTRQAQVGRCSSTAV